MMDAIDFQPYLESLPDPANQEWGDRYTRTQVELPLQVQAIVPEKSADPTTQRQPEEQKSERFEVLDGLRKAVREHHQVLLVGKPGSGKSTALRRLLWEEAQTVLEQIKEKEDEFTLPVLIELRGCSEGSVLDWIEAELQIDDLDQRTIKSLLKQGRLLILLDGLNEIPSDKSWRVLEAFLQNRHFQSTPIIVTTRELGAGANLGVEKRLEMLPLTEPQMREFIQKRLPGRADHLLRQLQGRLRELAETPLLLQMLCDVVAKSQDGQIPQNRGELFRQEFARRYEAFKPLRGRVSEDSRRFAPELLQQLAFVMTQGEPHTDPLKPTPSWLTISKPQAETILETYLTGRVEAPAQAAKEWLEDLLEFHLLQVASNPSQIEFHHQLFQEYYAAEKLLTLLPTLSDDELKQDYLNYLKWTEAISLMLGLPELTHSQTTYTVELALKIDLVLGARFADQVKEQFQYSVVDLVIAQPSCQKLKIKLLGETLSETAAWELSDLFEKADFSNRNDVLDELEKIGGNGISLAINKALKDETLYGRAFYLFGKDDTEQSFQILSEALENPDPDIRWGAAMALAEINSEMAIQVLSRAIRSSNFDVQFSAAFALGTLGFEIAIPILKQAIDLAVTSDICKMAIFALARIDSEQSYLLFSQLMQNPDLSKLAIDVLLIIDLEKINSNLRKDICILRHEYQTQINKVLESENIIDSLERVLQDSRPDIVESATILLKAIDKLSPQMLDSLWKRQIEFYQKGIAETISSIQNSYGFYNYEIAQAANRSLTPPSAAVVKTILVLASSPINEAQLRLDKEVREIDAALQRSQKRDQFKLEQRWAVRAEDLRRALIDLKPHIVHFCGHGVGEAGLLLEDDRGLAKPVHTEALANLFELCADHVECVLLNACYSDVQAGAIVQHIPYVIGMQDAVGDIAAIKFANGFYDGIGGEGADDNGYETAYKFGCNAIHLENLPGHLIPRLLKKADLTTL